MSVYHDEIEIEDFEYDEEEEMYYYPCPCGDRFQVSREELMAGEEVATCPSCSLVVKVIYDPEAFAAEQDEAETNKASGTSGEQLEKN
ncbi:diphthamide biosynthesis protein 3 [Anopheles bellator]|uniref:diphthamide biosynthesis protein 3 n=1 Tax=Anopheles bellator TaxID=139047 RepID=UPI0026482AA1|nr:diphthamide biosynthesis protein 3 [Anopheles bellator]